MLRVIRRAYICRMNPLPLRALTRSALPIILCAVAACAPATDAATRTAYPRLIPLDPASWAGPADRADPAADVSARAARLRARAAALQAAPL